MEDKAENSIYELFIWNLYDKNGGMAVYVAKIEYAHVSLKFQNQFDF